MLIAKCHKSRPHFYRIWICKYSGVRDTDFYQTLDCYVNLHDTNLTEKNTLNFKNIGNEPQADHKLQILKQKLPNQYINK